MQVSFKATLHALASYAYDHVLYMLYIVSFWRLSFRNVIVELSPKTALSL